MILIVGVLQISFNTAPLLNFHFHVDKGRDKKRGREREREERKRKKRERARKREIKFLHSILFIVFNKSLFPFKFFPLLPLEIEAVIQQGSQLCPTTFGLLHLLNSTMLHNIQPLQQEIRVVMLQLD